jgi:hypothetical protein
MFPFTVKYKIKCRTLERLDKVKSISYLNVYIENQKGKSIEISDDKIRFRISFFIGKWSKFNLIERGEFVLTDHSLSFKFYMYRFFLLLALLASYCGYMTENYFVAVLIFLILGVGNWIFALVKFRIMTSRLATTISNL